MIDLIFELAGSFVLVRIEGSKVSFANSTFGAYLATIDGLKLNKAGVIKEFPDLKDNKEWRAIAITRFKDKVAAMKTEDEVAAYILEDLKGHNYIPRFKQKSGFRKEVL